MDGVRVPRIDIKSPGIAPAEDFFATISESVQELFANIALTGDHHVREDGSSTRLGEFLPSRGPLACEAESGIVHCQIDVFSAKHFLDIASRTTIDVTLASLTKMERFAESDAGLYDMPKINPALGGKLSPDIDEAARAIARRQRWKIVPDGAWAANLLGLSTQVPSKITYLTDGPNNQVPIGCRTIHFKHARPKVLAGLEGKYALVVQALRHLGRDRVGAREIETLRAALSQTEKRRLVRDTRFGVDWIYEAARKIAEKAA